MFGMQAPNMATDPILNQTFDSSAGTPRMSYNTIDPDVAVPSKQAYNSFCIGDASIITSGEEHIGSSGRLQRAAIKHGLTSRFWNKASRVMLSKRL